MTPRPPLDEILALFRATVAAEGITTGAGAGTGTSIVDAGLALSGANSFFSMLMVLYPGQPRLVDSMDITGFTNGTGEVIFDRAYKGIAAAIPAGVPYKIVTFRFVPAEVAALTVLVNTLITSSGRDVPHKDQWCDPSAVVPTLAFSNAAADKVFPSVVLPAAGTFLPAGAVIQSVYLLVKWRKQYNSSVAANAISAANKTIRIKTAAHGWNVSLIAMTMANGDWETVAGPAPAGVEGGDMMIGSVDIKAEVSAFGTTYNIETDFAVNNDAIVVTAASLTLYGVATGLRVYYTLA